MPQALLWALLLLRQRVAVSMDGDLFEHANWPRISPAGICLNMVNLRHGRRIARIHGTASRSQLDTVLVQGKELSDLLSASSVNLFC